MVHGKQIWPITRAAESVEAGSRHINAMLQSTNHHAPQRYPHYLIVPNLFDGPISASLRDPSAASVRSGKRTVLYQFYQSYADALAPLQGMATAFGHALGRGWPGMPETQFQRGIIAACELFAEGRLQHHRPEFGIDSVMAGNRSVAVREEKTWVRPFATLLHFAKDTTAPQPKV